MEGWRKIIIHADPWAEKKVMPGVWWESDAPLGVLWNVTWLKSWSSIQKGYLHKQARMPVKLVASERPGNDMVLLYTVSLETGIKATGFLFVYVESFFQIQISY